jgi:uncharacterized protein YecE (DUF72 family)
MQLDLFGAPVRKQVEPVPPTALMSSWAAALPDGLRFGTCSWVFPGWTGIVFQRPGWPPPSTAVSIESLRAEGLAAYASHPLLRTVSVDRTFYAPVPSETFREYAQSVTEDFRFVVKAHDALTLPRFPIHPRYGARRGELNGLYLDPSYAADAVVAPYLEGLGNKGGGLLFQFSPMGSSDLEPERFPERLYRFLSALPKGPRYAVEVRNGSLVTPRYGQALRAAGAIHALNVWGSMPPLQEQARIVGTAAAPVVMIRWMLPAELTYEEARARYQPFNRLVEVDEAVRAAIRAIAQEALAAGKAVFILINNKAEGSAPLTAFALAERLAATI